MNGEVVVVGAGVSGLTCAVRLLEAGYGVRVLAAERFADDGPLRGSAEGPPGMCSKRAAAVWYPYAIEPLDRVGDWANRSLTHYRELEGRGDNGVSIIRLAILFGRRPQAVQWKLLTECKRKVVPVHKLPPGYEVGLRLRVPFIDTTVFLPFLESRVRELGGTVERCDALASMDQMRSLGRVVVNCTGLGAMALCGDADMFPLRGQVLRVQAPGVKRWSVALPRRGHPIYVFPRTNDCVLGGTEEHGEWGERPNEDTLRAIEAACCWLEPVLAEGYGDARAAVGLRPGRKGGVRLETETFADSGVIVHNYGHGGAGFTVAWGCADEVTMHVGQQLGSAASPITPAP